MKAKHILVLLPLLCTGMLFLSGCKKGGNEQALLIPYKLECQYGTEPFSDEAWPVLSWQLQSTAKNQFQTAFQILVATDSALLKPGKADLWDSGKIENDQSNGVTYAGKALSTGEVCFWKVRCWDKAASDGAWSAVSQWNVALMNPNDWKAKWLTFDTATASAQPLFRTSFLLEKPIKRATAYVSGLGYYELYLNGNKIGDHVLDPAQTNYDDYALYAAYDVTKSVNNGTNGLGIMLGDGWYNQNIVWMSLMDYGKPLLICQIEVEYQDGTKKHIVSDESWQWTNGPVIKSNVYAGEVYDARKEIEGWSKAEKPSGNWFPVVLAKEHPPKLKLQSLPPIKKMAALPVQRFYKTDSNQYIFDFGQNFAGWAKLKIQAAKGTHIQIRLAEEIDKNGNLDSRSTGVGATGVEQIEEYICKGGGEETWEPRFTYHGFRYAEVSGLPSAPSKETLTGIVVHTAVENAGTFSCSDKQINRLHKMAQWTLVSNLHGIPTDCPHREKCGWLGDAHVMAPTTIYNYNLESFWIKYLYDIRSSSRKEEATIFHVARNIEFRNGVKPAGIPHMVAPGKRTNGVASVGWGTAVVQLPWYVYLYYGNKPILKEFYPDMKRWTDYVHTLALKNIIYEGLGDWCPPGGNKTIECPIALSSTAYYLLDLDIMAKTAKILNKQEDMKHYLALQKQVKKAFNQKFYQPKAHTYGSQTANAMALDFGLVPQGEEQKVSNAIVTNAKQQYEGFLHTGIFGLPRLLNVLGSNGNAAAAYNILSKKGENSFETMCKVYNATTLWEVLPVDTRYNNEDTGSHNHPMQAGFDQWFYAGILGIKPDEQNPGFKVIQLSPELTDELEWASGTFNSKYGAIKSDWRKVGKEFSWNVSIPVNTTAILHIPATSEEAVMEGGKMIKNLTEIEFLRMEGDRAIIKLGSGDYQFVVKQD